MYGVRNTEAGQSYYDSLIEMYASWGVDFIKCDDICDSFIYRNDSFSGWHETEMLYKAIQKSNREIVLSLSPGPAHIDRAWQYCRYANMQTCGVLRMISGITGSFLRICSGDVSYGRIM